MTKTRDDLIADVQYGRLEPSEAEAEAARLGFQPFARTPDPNHFDPTEEEWWTLVMAVAWIATRDIESVRENHDPYRLECWDWHFREWRVGVDGAVHKGHFIEPRRPVTLPLWAIAHSLRDENESDLSAREAEKSLWGALQANQLQATGRPSSGGQRILIPDYEWNDLKPFEEKGRDVVREDSLSPLGYDDIKLRRKAVMSLWPEQRASSAVELVPTVSPTGPGYFPLYCAAHWIATEGGAKVFDPTGTAVWKGAFDALLARVASGQVNVTGMRAGIREKIDAHIFAALRIDYPYSQASMDLMFSHDLHLVSYAYVDDEHWQKGFDDSLRVQRQPRWSKLMVLKSDILQFWAYSVAPGSTSEIAKGAPGRPTSMHYVTTEHQRRLESKVAEASVAAEARALTEWFKRTHPNAPSLTQKTIENNIRATHRAARPPEIKI